MIMSEQNEFSGFVDGQQVECVISYDKDRDLYECIVAKDGEIDNKFYSIKRSAMETIAKVLTKWKE
tara:strand:+ start:84 stop:281 length:198 start_codon:yes stop_codon:yes gene_type:complete